MNDMEMPSSSSSSSSSLVYYLSDDKKQQPTFSQPDNNLMNPSQQHLVDVSVGFSPNHISPENENEFGVCDLVWGKVKSHPWWPGQIFHTSHASQRALKYHHHKKTKDTALLVAYFGDRTFAWNHPSSLKHFQPHFSHMENQSDSLSFRTAVHLALNELRRRLVLGLLCNCTPIPFYRNFASQIFQNPGILHTHDATPSPLTATSFHPAQLLHLIKALAPNPFPPLDTLHLNIAHSHLTAFFSFKGYYQLQHFHVYGGLLDEDEDDVRPKHISQPNPSRKKKYASHRPLHPTRKKRSLSDLFAGKKATSTRMPPAQTNVDNDSPAPQSFKVGECIRRIASQLTGSPPILKSTVTHFQPSADKINRGSKNEASPDIPEGSHRRLSVPNQYSSPDVMLSQLCLAARDPMKGYSFLSIIVDFFSGFRNSISLECSTPGKQKGSEKIGHGIRKSANNISNETFNFEEMGDSYWTDMVIQSSPEEQPSRRSRKRKQISDFEVPTELDGSSYEAEDPLELNLVLDFDGKNDDDDYIVANEKPSRKYRKRKINSQILLPLDKQVVVAEKTINRLNDNKYVNDFSPTALLMNFMESDSVPSEINLNKIFRRFGPLKESETKVLRDTGSATVVFKKQIDAEVAFSSAAKFSIFGAVHVSYQLRFQV